jgi:hypothetical protein
LSGHGSGRLRPGRASRTEIVVTVAFLAAVTAIFVVIAVLSYGALRGDEAEPPSNLPPLAIDGREQTVFDYTEDACSPIDIPDAPARAFRDADGRVHLIASHYVTRALVGPSLDAVRHDCRLVLKSRLDGDPSRFTDREWVTAPYTTDGRDVYALVHNEYQGDKHVGQCPSGKYLSCWYNSITLARSTDGGRTFRHALPPPRHLVAAIPYRYQPDGGPIGLFQPSNVVRRDDGHYYALIHTEAFGSQRAGTCVIRTARLDRPDAWRAWDGDGYDVTFVDPYLDGGAGGHVCAPVSFPEIVGMTHSLTYSSYLQRYVLVGQAGRQEPGRRGVVWGFYYSTSANLIDWTPRRLIREVGFPQNFECGDPNPVAYPSLIDSHSPARNFDVIGRRPWLYFTRFHFKDCRNVLNRDLVRVRLRFAK